MEPFSQGSSLLPGVSGLILGPHGGCRTVEHNSTFLCHCSLFSKARERPTLCELSRRAGSLLPTDSGSRQHRCVYLSGAGLRGGQGMLSGNSPRLHCFAFVWHVLLCAEGSACSRPSPSHQRGFGQEMQAAVNALGTGRAQHGLLC